MRLSSAIGIAFFISPFLALTGCGVSPLEQCHDGSTVLCRRLFECATQPMKSAPDFLSQYGGTEAECVSKQTARCGDENACHVDSGFDSSRAVDCVADMQTATCQGFMSGAAMHTNCEAVCLAAPISTDLDEE